MSHKITLEVKVSNPDLFASIVEQETGLVRLPTTARFWSGLQVPNAVLVMGRRWGGAGRAMLAVGPDGTLHLDSDYRTAIQRCLKKYAAALIVQAASTAGYPVQQEQRSDGTLILRMAVAR